MLSGLEIKKELCSNPELIIDVLESIGCEHIKLNGVSVTSTRPGGTNKQSVRIRLTELLPSKCFTRQVEFESKYEKRDFLELMQYLMGDVGIIDVIKRISKICGFNCQGQIEAKQQIASISFIKSFKQATREEVVSNCAVLPEVYMQDFIHHPSYDFLQDNIDLQVQQEFGVCYDIFNNRVCFPVRNELGQLLSVKGRTLYKDFKQKGIPKYLYYVECNMGDFLYGEYENKAYIECAKEIILVESEKAVMQLASYGIRNVLATSKKNITKQQLLRLLRYGKSIVLAYDKDVTIEEVGLELSKFKSLVDTSYIQDTDNLLGPKDSPSDKGYLVWEQLYKNKIKMR